MAIDAASISKLTWNHFDFLLYLLTAFSDRKLCFGMLYNISTRADMKRIIAITMKELANLERKHQPVQDKNAKSAIQFWSANDN
jgi:hypothetical protein